MFFTDRWPGKGDTDTPAFSTGFQPARQAADGYLSEERRASRECQCEWKFEVRVLYVGHAALSHAPQEYASHTCAAISRFGMHCVEVRTSDENRAVSSLPVERTQNSRGDPEWPRH